MSAPKNTPAPWETCKEYSAPGAVDIVSDSHIIAEVYGYGEEAEANAHLIAAARDMYEALKEVKAAFKALIMKKPYDLSDAAALTHEALAKAEGGVE